MKNLWIALVGVLLVAGVVAWSFTTRRSLIEDRALPQYGYVHIQERCGEIGEWREVVHEPCIGEPTTRGTLADGTICWVTPDGTPREEHISAARCAGWTEPIE